MSDNITDEESDIEYKEAVNKLNKVTNILNEFYKEYKVEYFDKAICLSVDETEIMFYFAGAVNFENKEVKE